MVIANPTSCSFIDSYLGSKFHIILAVHNISHVTHDEISTTAISFLLRNTLELDKSMVRTLKIDKSMDASSLS